MNLDYLLALKEKSGLTNEQIAKVSGVPESTVIRVFSGKTDNPYFQTIVDIVKSMGGSVDEMESFEPRRDTGVQVEGESKLIKLYREIIRNKNKWINILALLLGVTVSIFIFLLMYDIMNPSTGWFRH